VSRRPSFRGISDVRRITSMKCVPLWIQAASESQVRVLRIPTEPATCTDLKAATYSDPMPAGVPI